MFFIRSLFVAGFAGVCCAVAAQSDPQTITVTATRTPASVNALVAEVTVLDRASIEKAEGRTLVELLARQPGLQASSNGGPGKTASIFIRGLEARHTLLLVDGVRVGSATVGTPSLDNLPLEAIERIEIVRGPMSALYGSGAMGGVIQVFTRRGGQGLTANAKAGVGSNAFRQAAAGIGLGDGRYDFAAQAQTTDVKGISATNERVPFGSYNPDHDGWRQGGGSARFGWNPAGDWRVELLGLAARGTTRLDDGPGADAKARLENRLASASAGGSVTAGWQTRVVLSESVDRYVTLASASPFTDLGAIETRQRQAGWQNTVATPAGALLLLAERSEERVSRPGAAFEVSRRDVDAAALGLSGTTGPHAWQASARHDRDSQFGGQNTGAVAYGYALTPAWRVGASAGTSFVAPSFNQLYYPGFGNPNLEPEQGRHAEINLRWQAGEHRVFAAVYRNRYRGFITSGPQPQNLPWARIEGATLAWEARWQRLSWQASYDRTDPRNHTAGNRNFDKLLPRRAQNAARLAADWDGGAWQAGATLAAFSHRFDDAANTTRLGGYATLDLRADWALAPGWRLGAALNNAGARRYETALGYNQPRREGFVTLRWAVR